MATTLLLLAASAVLGASPGASNATTIFRSGADGYHTYVGQPCGAVRFKLLFVSFGRKPTLTYPLAPPLWLLSPPHRWDAGTGSRQCFAWGAGCSCAFAKGGNSRLVYFTPRILAGLCQLQSVVTPTCHVYARTHVAAVRAPSPRDLQPPPSSLLPHRYRAADTNPR